MRKLCLILLSCGTIMASSCVRSSNDLEDCERIVKIELEWIGVQPRNTSEQVDISIIPRTRGTERDITSDIYGREVDLLPQFYDLIGIEPTENVTVTGRNISVPLDANGMVTEPTQLFSAGITTAQVYDNIVYQVIPLPMREQVRELIVMIQFGGPFAPLVAGVTATLDGVAQSRDIANAFPPDPSHNRPYAVTRGSIGYTLLPETIGTTGEWYVGKRFLLGIDGDNNQTLNVTVNYSSGISYAQTFDVTSMLTGFHTEDLPNPWYIILNIDLNQQYEFAITDWYGGGEYNLIAD